MRRKLIILLFLLIGLCLLAACAEEADTSSAESTSSKEFSVPGEPSAIPPLSTPSGEESEESYIEESSLPGESSGEGNTAPMESSEEESSGPEDSAIEESWAEESSMVEESSATEDPSQPEASSEPEASFEPDESSEPEEDPKPHKVNGFIVYGDRAMEPFGGSAKGGQYTAEVFNQFKERVGEGVNVYAMPIPLACTFYAPEGYEKSITNMVNCYGGLRDALVGVEYVDLIAALGAHSEEYIYARTDHHWMALGAYYAAEAFCKVADADFATLDRFTQKSFDGFLGSAVKAFGVKELEKYPETFYWYEPTREYTAHYYNQEYEFSFSGTMFSKSKSYVKFIYGDSYAVRVETGVQNGRKLLVIKDSYGNALVPFLIEGFEEVYVVDYRDFECNILEFIEENEITDVSFALAGFAIASSKRDNIIRLMEQ